MFIVSSALEADMQGIPQGKEGASMEERVTVAQTTHHSCTPVMIVKFKD